MVGWGEYPVYVGQLVRFRDPTHAGYRFLDRMAAGVVVEVDETPAPNRDTPYVTVNFGFRTACGGPYAFEAVDARAFDLPEVCDSVLKAGCLAYFMQPVVTHDRSDAPHHVLSWHHPYERLEIRIRPSGLINWYYQGRGGCGGNEGWTRYDPRKKGGSPWTHR
ncbi:MAG: hypothetical protein EBT79_07565 [Actinobacteria bacterium]|nr:hypothetical protein [Actinomycetota bacterium]NBR67117.1 hypothetical protein [Actinomycetota bacterium]